jgi:hypothetical protein
MKPFLLAAAITAAVVSCVSTQPAELPTCDQLLEHLAAEQKALGREMVMVGQFSVATFAWVFQDGAGKQYGLMLALPGSLVPAEDSPFKYSESCRAEQGTGRVFKATFEGQPSL